MPKTFEKHSRVFARVFMQTIPYTIRITAAPILNTRAFLLLRQICSENDFVPVRSTVCVSMVLALPNMTATS